MEIKVILIEREDRIEHLAYGSSGIMLNNTYIICTANVLWTLLKKDFSQLKPGELHPISFPENSTNIRVVWKHEETSRDYCIKDSDIIAVYISSHLRSSAKQTLEYWAVDTPGNSQELEKKLAIFFIMKVEPTGDVLDFKKCLDRWWQLIKNEEISQLDEIFIKSVPFGNKFFLDSYSRGIVSNVVGHNSSIIVSDCPTVAGGEGSPVYKVGSDVNIPFGMVISTSCWWRKDWTGLTLIIDFRCVLSELIMCQQNKMNLECTPHHRLLATVETCFLQIYCGQMWGTAIIVDIENGILLTNSHVVDNQHQIKIHWKGQNDIATIIYRTPNEEVYDLAILKCDVRFLKSNNLRFIRKAGKFPLSGDTVYSVGYALFSKNVGSNPTVSKGHIVQSCESMIQTTCCVNPGMSGGAVVNCLGELAGVIVCNTKLEELVYPRFNMAIPYISIHNVVSLFLHSKDCSILSQLCVDDRRLTSYWKMLEAKL